MLLVPYRYSVLVAVSLWIVLLIAPTIVVVTSQPITPPIRRPVRTNLHCVNATIIPSRVITTNNPYVHNTTIFTRLIAPYSYGFDRAPPNVTCPYLYGHDYNVTKKDVHSAWYQWTPKSSGYYDFNATIAGFFDFWFSIMEGSSCSNLMKPIGCRLESPRGVYLYANTSYYITMFSVSENGYDLDLIISPTIFRPSNDDCQNATLIPSSVKLPYKEVSAANIFTNATIQPNERIASCDQFVIYDGYTELVDGDYGRRVEKDNFGGHSVWYTYSPPITGYYNFQTLGTMSRAYLSDPIDAPITIALYEVIGNTNQNATSSSSSICSDMTNQFLEVFCSRRPGRFYRSIDRINELKAGKQYYIQLIPDMYNREVITNLEFTISRTSAPITNDLCTNATVIDPMVGIQNALVNPNYASTDALFHSTKIVCESGGYPANLLQNGVWYKYIHPGGIVEIVHSLSIRSRGATYYLFEGDSCDSLRCINFRYGSYSGGAAVTYVIDEPATYWFFLYPEGVANFTVSIQRPNHFRLINAENDTFLGLLPPNKLHSYNFFVLPSELLPTSELNIDAYFQPELNVQSTRITYSNPNTTRCENTVPYTVFGDTDGNYRPGKITIGAHTISALPYTQPKCQGPAIAGAAITTTFTMQGCHQGWLFYLTESNQNYYVNYMGIVPCTVVMGGSVHCGFPVKNISVELKYSNTSILVDAVKSVTYSDDNTYYFGIFNASSTFGVSPMTLLPGTKYTMTLIVDNIRQDSLSPFSTPTVCVP